MAKKFKIVQNPTFKAKVNVPRVGGQPIEIEFEYKYLPRKELAALYDSWGKETQELVNSDLSDVVALTELEIKLQVKQLKEILVGWDFDDEFSDENITSLVETSVHSAGVITDAYAEAYSKARLGN